MSSGPLKSAIIAALLKDPNSSLGENKCDMTKCNNRTKIILIPGGPKFVMYCDTCQTKTLSSPKKVKPIPKKCPELPHRKGARKVNLEEDSDEEEIRQNQMSSKPLSAFVSLLDKSLKSYIGKTIKDQLSSQYDQHEKSSFMKRLDAECDSESLSKKRKRAEN